MNTYSVVLMGQQNNNMIITEHSREQNLPSRPLGEKQNPTFWQLFTYSAFYWTLILIGAICKFNAFFSENELVSSYTASSYINLVYNMYWWQF